MSKANNSMSEEPNVRVTRSARRGSSVDLEQKSLTTPLKSNLLETISEAGSVDSLLTPRRRTRQNVVAPDYGTPPKNVSHLLTKENLTRLENLTNTPENPSTPGKRITRRTSLTSEEQIAAKLSATLPYVRLLRHKVAPSNEPIGEDSFNTIREGNRTSKMVTADEKQTPNKVDKTVESSPNDTRRSISKSPSTTLNEIGEFDQLDKNQARNLTITLNQISPPKIISSTADQNKAAAYESIEAIGSSDESADADEPLAAYYRKFMGTIQKNLEDEERLASDTKLTEKNESINIQIISDDEATESIDQHHKKQYIKRVKLSLSNTTSMVAQNLEVDNADDQHNTTQAKTFSNTRTEDITDLRDENCDAILAIAETKPLILNKDLSENEDVLYRATLPNSTSKERTPESSKNAPPIIISLITSREATPLKQLASDKSASPLKQTNPSLTHPSSKLATPGKPATPLKESTSANQQATGATVAKQAIPAKQATPAKQAIPAKQVCPTEQDTPNNKQIASAKSATEPKLVEKLETSKSLESTENINKIVEVLGSTAVSESLTTPNNSTQHIETKANGSKVLYLHEEEVSFKMQLDEDDNDTNKSTLSYTSVDDLEYIDKSEDDCVGDSFETFTKVFSTRAKSCPTSLNKNLLQSQDLSSSFHGTSNLENVLERDELKANGNVSSPSDMVVVKDHQVGLATELDVNLHEMSSSNKFKGRLTYIVHGDVIEIDTQEDKSKKEISSSAQKQKRRSSIAEPLTSVKTSVSRSYVELEIDNQENAETDNEEETGSQNITPAKTSLIKKQRRGSISDHETRSNEFYIGKFSENVDHGKSLQVTQDKFTPDTNSPKNQLSLSIVEPISHLDESEGRSFMDPNTQAKVRSETSMTKKQASLSLSVSDTVLPSNSADVAVDESDIITTKVTDQYFVTKRKHKVPFVPKAHHSDEDNQTADLTNTSFGVFVETNNNQNVSFSDNNQSSKTKISKNKTPTKVTEMIEKREIQTETSSAKKRKRTSLPNVIATVSPLKYFVEADSQAETVSQNISRTETCSAKKQKHRSLTELEEPLNGSTENFVENGDPRAATESNSAKKQRSSSFENQSAVELFIEPDKEKETPEVRQNKSWRETSSTKKQNRLSFSDSEPVMTLNSSGVVVCESDLSTVNVTNRNFITQRKHKLHFVRSPNGSYFDDQAVGSPNASPGGFVETDNDTNISFNENNNKSNSRKKTPTKDQKVKVKRKISLEEIQARCNEILEQRTLARKMVHDQFKKQKSTMKTGDSVNTVSALPSPKSKKISNPLEPEKKTENLEIELIKNDAKDVQSSLDISGGSNNSGKSKSKKKNIPTDCAISTELVVRSPKPLEVSNPIERGSSKKKRKSENFEKGVVSKNNADEGVHSSLDVNVSSNNCSKSKSKTMNMPSRGAVNTESAVGSPKSDETSNSIERESKKLEHLEKKSNKKSIKDLDSGLDVSVRNNNSGKSKLIEMNVPSDGGINTESAVRLPKSVEISNPIKRSSPKKKKRSDNLERESKKNSSEDVHSGLDISVGSNNSEKSKSKKYIQSGLTQDVETSPQKFKKVKLYQTTITKEIPSTSNRLPQIKINKVDIDKNLLPIQPVKSRRAKKRNLDNSNIIIETKTGKRDPIHSDEILKVPSTSTKRQLLDDIANQLDDYPKTQQSSKKLKLSSFIEKERTPEYRPGGFKVSPITPKILPNKFRVSIMAQKMAKKKLKFNESQPVWTTAGVFEESNLGEELLKHVAYSYSTMNFIVEDMGNNSNRALRKNKKKRVGLLDFKHKSLSRSNDKLV